MMIILFLYDLFFGNNRCSEKHAFIVFQKILWIGAIKFAASNQESAGTSKLAAMLYNLSQKNCDLIVVGKQACETFVGKSSYVMADLIENASIVWEFLKGRKLHGLLALDRVCFFLTQHAVLHKLQKAETH